MSDAVLFFVPWKRAGKLANRKFLLPATNLAVFGSILFLPQAPNNDCLLVSFKEFGCTVSKQNNFEEKMLKETGCYLAGFGLAVFCFLGGNILVNFVWGFGADYSGWSGPIRAAIATISMIIFYYTLVPKLRFLQLRHAALPPILLGLAGLALIGVVLGLAYIRGVHEEAISLELLSSLVPFLGWAAFGFWLLAQPAESLT